MKDIRHTTGIPISNAIQRILLLIFALLFVAMVVLSTTAPNYDDGFKAGLRYGMDTLDKILIKQIKDTNSTSVVQLKEGTKVYVLTPKRLKTVWDSINHHRK